MSHFRLWSHSVAARIREWRVPKLVACILAIMLPGVSLSYAGGIDDDMPVLRHASGSNRSFFGSIRAGMRTLEMRDTTDFATGEGIEIEGAGPPNTASPPTTVTATPRLWQAYSNFPRGSVIATGADDRNAKFYKVVASAVAIGGWPGACVETGRLATCMSSMSLPLPFGVGATIKVSAVSVSGYNGSRRVTAFSWNRQHSVWQFSFDADPGLPEGAGGHALFAGTGAGGGQSGASDPNSWGQARSENRIDGTAYWLECTGRCNNRRYGYRLVARDRNRAFAAPTPTIIVSNAALDQVAYNTIGWKPAINDLDVIVCRDGTPIAVVPASDGEFIDVGSPAIYGLHPDIPRTICLAGPRSGPLIAHITNRSRSTYTLSQTADTTVSNGVVVHDDTAALNNFAALLFSGSNNGAHAYCPKGNYLITLPWRFDGKMAGPGWGFALTGSSATARGNAGCHIIYHGSALAAVENHGALVLDGVNSSHFSDLSIDANDIATAAIQITNSDNLHFSSGVRLEHVYGADIPESKHASGIAVGFRGCPGYQVSEVYIDDFQTQGVGIPAIVGYGFRAWCGNNEKNFMIRRITCAFLYGCVNTSANGYVKVEDIIEAQDTGVTFTGATEIADIIGGESENTLVTGSRLFRFTAAGNPANLQIQSFSFQSTPPPDGAVGYAIGSQASILSEGNEFYYGTPYYASAGAQVTSLNDWFNGEYSPEQLVRGNTAFNTPLNCLPGGGGACNPFIELKNDSGGTFGNIIQFGNWSSMPFTSAPPR
jgi:hypothetical protein